MSNNPFKGFMRSKAEKADDDMSHLRGAPPSFQEAIAESSAAGPSPGPSGAPPAAAATSSATAPSFRTPFAAITLNMYDRIRLINFGEGDATAVVEVVKTWWRPGVSNIRPYGAATEIKCHGYPWQSSPGGPGDDGARRTLLHMLETLYDRGWVLQAAVDISMKTLDKDTLIFRKQHPPPPPCDWLAISFDRGDKLKIVDQPPADLGEALIASFGKRVANVERENNRFKIKFHGYPWSPSGEETVNTRLMVLNMVAVFEKFGFTFYASIDHHNDADGLETDLMIMHRQKDWVPGQPVWHR